MLSKSLNFKSNFNANSKISSLFKLNLTHRQILFLLLSLDLLALLYASKSLSIGADEARVYFQSFHFDAQNSFFTNFTLQFFAQFFKDFFAQNSSFFLSALLHLSTYFLGQNDFALRLPLLILHLVSCLLLYFLALKTAKKQADALLSLLLFMLLPATLASALIVHPASLMIALSLGILCAYEYEKKWLFYALLSLAFFVEQSFFILYLALFIYGFYKKDFFMLSFNLALLALNFYLYGYEGSGKPKSYFLETLGVFAACFSPLVFAYFFYVIYRLFSAPKKPLLYFIITTTFIFCLLLSLRQRLHLEDFLPFCVISTPLLISTLMHSYRVRMPNLRLFYNILIQASLVFLLLCYLALIFNPLLYHFSPKNFAQNYHFAKELAFELKKRGIKALRTDENMQIRLKFYGIEKNNALILRKSEAKNADFSVSVGGFKNYYRLVKNERD